MGDTVADTAVKYIRNHPEETGYCVWSGCPHTVHEIASLCGVRDRSKTKHGRHPLNVIKKTIDSLEGDERFEKRYVRLRTLVRCFELKEEYR